MLSPQSPPQPSGKKNSPSNARTRVREPGSTIGETRFAFHDGRELGEAVGDRFSVMALELFSAVEFAFYSVPTPNALAGLRASWIQVW